MKKFFLLLYLLLFAFLFSCSTDIDLYADYKQVPIIYGVLDPTADTNFVKITRAFYVEGDAYQSADNPDSSNYSGKLDARLIEYCDGDSIREIILDTITLHNKKPGIFYGPNQKLYYTAEPLGRNTSRNKYRYKLTIVFPDRTLSTYANLVGTDGFGPRSLAVNFSKSGFGLRIPFLFHPALNASIYTFDFSFTYHEQRTPDSDTIPHTMTWHLGTYYESELTNQAEGDNYVFYYRPENFYGALEEFIGADTAIPGLRRLVTDYPFTITMTAGGDNLRQYLYYISLVDPSSLNDSGFSMITGARGVFSSKMTKTAYLRWAGTTLPELLEEDKWGFEFMGGQEP